MDGEKAMAPHSSTLAWKIPWMEEPGGLQSMGSRRVGHNWAISLSLFTFVHWRRKWQPTPVFLPGESQGRGSLVGLWGHTEWLSRSSTQIKNQFSSKIWIFSRRNSNCDWLWRWRFGKVPTSLRAALGARGGRSCRAPVVLQPRANALQDTPGATALRPEIQGVRWSRLRPQRFKRGFCATHTSFILRPYPNELPWMCS